MELLDAFLGHLIALCQPHDHLVVVSDHGNLEEPEHHQHTFNPVPLLVCGPRAPLARPVTDLSQIAGLIEALLASTPLDF